MKRLILVEGLPGTGKTTVTGKLSDHFARLGENVTALFEGDSRIPSDFRMTAGVPSETFEAVRAAHPDIEEERWAVALRTARYAYVRLDRCAPVAVDAFRRWDMGDEHNRELGAARYMDCASERLERWVSDNLENDTTVVMDSGFLQNPINELLFRKASDAEIRAYVQSAARLLGPLHPLCFYLKRETAQEAISYAARAKGEEWMARVTGMLREIGCTDLFERRFALEVSLVSCIAHIVCSVTDGDWTDADRRIASLT